jgi:phage I-like protein
MDFDEAIAREAEAQAEALRTAVHEGYQSNRVMAEGLAADGEAPQWIQLTPGRTFEGRDGRKFKVQSARAIVAAFKAAAEHLLVDIDHTSEMYTGSSLSYGWVTDLAVRNNGQLWAKVEWTADGEEYIITKQFRSVSPVFFVSRESQVAFFEDGSPMEILGLKSVALTNQPNLRIASLNTEQPETENEPMKFPTALVTALNVAADADEATILAAIQKLQAQPEPKAEVQALDLNAYVPRADYDALASKVSTLESNAAKTAADAHGVQVEAAITEALKAGKIAPASEAYHREVCKTVSGLESFKAFTKTAAPIVAPNVATAPAGEPIVKADKLTEQQLNVARALGLTAEQYTVELNRLSADPSSMRAVTRDDSDK